MDSARTLVTRGWRISFVSRCLRVSRAQLHAIARRPDDWQDRRCKRQPDDTEALARIHAVIGEVPTYGYRRVWALLRRQSETEGVAAINAKRVYRIMRQHALLLEHRPALPVASRAQTGSSSAVTMEKNCELPSRWTAAIVKRCTGWRVQVGTTAPRYRM